MTVVPPIAVIHHDKENRTLVTGFEGRGAYSYDVSYASSSQRIRALMARSGPCHQQLKYECRGAVIKTSLNGSRTLSYWIANGQKVTSYWPGGNAQLGGCACYQTKSCAGGKKCNCDMNDQVWREDSGLVTDKDVLPITGLRIAGVTFPNTATTTSNTTTTPTTTTPTTTTTRTTPTTPSTRTTPTTRTTTTPTTTTTRTTPITPSTRTTTITPNTTTTVAVSHTRTHTEQVDLQTDIFVD
ncbi:integumentary mucin C.1-like [Lingula anatina]|uniref:Integumentary mucin C.1-like n=1 Tax=Lingula anatina TaxID=7574 RepID=A0A1S3HRZ1_LINAN|nr:integumentary mucin C.1-like [Lingula anatina]|eukprot:XP_013388800.2 integumentary mucin C.1-like [Lingula anatina]